MMPQANIYRFTKPTKKKNIRIVSWYAPDRLAEGGFSFPQSLWQSYWAAENHPEAYDEVSVTVKLSPAHLNLLVWLYSSMAMRSNGIGPITSEEWQAIPYEVKMEIAEERIAYLITKFARTQMEGIENGTHHVLSPLKGSNK